MKDKLLMIPTGTTNVKLSPNRIWHCLAVKRNINIIKRNSIKK